jgi:DNA-binding transcriptional LysR family regulator
MELRHIRYFLAVAEELNFTRAAVRVGIGQSPLSQQIRALEAELGAALFRRVPQGAELTTAGLAFLPEARATLQQADRATHAARRGAKGNLGRLRLGYTSSAGFNGIVPAVLRTFQAQYPAVDLTLEEASTARLLERLLAADIDAAIIRPGRADPEDVRVLLLDDEVMTLVLPADHARAGADGLGLDEVKDEPFVLFPRDAGPSLFDEVIAGCRRAGFEPVLGQIAPEITSVGNLVAAGFGVSVVPVSIAQVRVAGVVYVPILGEPLLARLALATRPADHSVIVANFVALAARARGAVCVT